MRRFFTLRFFALGASLGLVVALVYVANFGMWMNRSLVDSDEFVGSAVAAFELESSREALASLVIDRLIDDRPVIAIASPLLEDLVARLLDGDGLESALTTVGTRLHAVLFDGSQQGIVVDFTEVGDRVVPPLERFFPVIADEIPDGFFGEVVIVETGTVPELSPYADALQRLTWFAVALAVALMVLIVRMVGAKWKGVTGIGAAVAVAGLLSVVLVNRARSLTISVPRNDDIGTLVVNLYDQTAGALRTQGWWLVAIGMAIVVAGVSLRRSDPMSGTDGPASSTA